MEKKEKILLILILGIVFVLLTNADINIQNNDGNNILKLSNDRVIGSPIFIDDADDNFNWSKTANENDWCTGSGTWHDPYIIRDLIIEGQIQTNCIEIKNSNASFIIQNCELFPSPQSWVIHGIKLENVNNSKILGNDIHSFLNEGSGAIVTWDSCNNNTISRNVIYDNCIGIYFTDGEKNIFSENRITYSEMYPFYLKGGKNNIIINNNITELTVAYGTVGAIELTGASDNLVKGNIITASYYYGIWIRTSPNNNVTENIIKNNGGYGIYLSDSNQINIIKNFLQSNSYGILLSNSDNNNIIENTALDHYGGEVGGISLWNSDNNNISGNIANNNYYGLELSQSNFNIVNNNSFELCSQTIYLAASKNNSIHDNYIAKFHSTAFDLFYNSQNNSIYNNIIDGKEFLARGRGIRLIDSHNNYLLRNSIIKCLEDGITLTSSTNNSILHNSIFGYQTCISGDIVDNYVQGNSLHWLDLAPVFIDDKNPTQDWLFLKQHYDWISGWGTKDSPYIIENATINGKNTKSCIEIVNSFRKFEIRNCILYNSGPGAMMAGITLLHTQQGKLLHNNCSLNNARGIYMYNSTHTKIIGNDVNDNILGGIYIENATKVIITSNTALRNTEEGIQLHIGNTNEIVDNIANSNLVGILLSGNNYNNTISGNEVNQNYNGIQVYLGVYNTISENIVSGNGYHGLIIEANSHHNYIWYNSLINNTHGIMIFNSHYNDVSDNDIIGSEKDALNILESDYNNISINNIIDNTYGIRSYGGEHSTIFENFIFGNLYGVYFEHRCYNNTIRNNDINYNENGLIINGESNNNLIYENDFIGNTNNVEDNSYLDPYKSIHRDTVNYGVTQYTGAFGSTDAGLWYFTDAYKYDDAKYLYLESTWGNDYPGTISMTWGAYGDFDDSIAANIDSISINYEIWADSYVGVLDESTDLSLLAYDEQGHMTFHTIASTPGHQVHYTGIWTISSGPIFDAVKAGGYIKNMGVSMYSDEELWTFTWINIDYVDINYNYMISGLINNQWDDGSIGNFYDDYIGDDLNDDGIGDEPYTIPGTAGVIDRYPDYSDKNEVTMEIIPHFIECFMGDDINFTIALTDYFGNNINLLLDAIEEKAYWDAHSRTRTHFSSFTNYSGMIFHNETGTPSYATPPEIYMLNFTMYPYASLMVAPEILEYDPNTQFSRQKIETYFQLDLDYLFDYFSVNELKDISYINATLFGAHFLEMFYVSNLIESFGKIEVYNYLTDSYYTLSDYIFDEAIKLGNVNNLLKSEDINDYSFGFTANELLKYVDSNNIITFRFFSYFEGILTNPENSYLSNFEVNAVLGTLLDYISFDVVWWKETPEIVIYNDIQTFDSRNTYTYNPTCPGTYTIRFEVRPNAYYKSVVEEYTINVKRRPVELTLDLSLSQAYTTEEINVSANVIDQLTKFFAINAKVNFYADFYGDVILLGTSFTDSYGIASISISNLNQGDYLIFAEVVENHGRHSEPYKDERFESDIWAYNISNTYLLHIDLAPTSLQLLSLAPEGYNVTVGQVFYVFPRFIDTTTGLEVYNEEITVYVNSILIGVYNSSTPFLISFGKPGEQIVECHFFGSELYESVETTKIFITKRLELSIIEISPAESIFFPNQQINITISANDLATNSPIEGLNISLYNNLTGLLASGLTKLDGTVTLTVLIPYDWASEYVTFYAINSPVVDMYLQRKTDEFEIRISPFTTDFLFNTDEIDLYVNENYTFSFELWNLDLQDFVNDAPILVTLYREYLGDLPGYTNLEVITSYNNSLTFTFSVAGSYNIKASYMGSDLYLSCYSDFTFEILKRPTYITINMTDMDLVPGNNFSITVNIVDALTNELILNKFISVSENIYDNGTLVLTKLPFEIKTNFTNTFLWQPLREADFEFLFSSQLNDDVHQNSNYSLLLSVKKRQVWIESYIQSYEYKIGDFININTTFIDLNTTHSDTIPGLLVHYLILEGDNIIYSENHTSDEYGVINFGWQIPSELANKTLTILIITAETNYFQSNYREVEVTTSPMATYFNIIMNPNPSSYINEEVILEIELLSIQGDEIEEYINYEIMCEELLYYETGVINLIEISSLLRSFSEAGRFVFKFHYLGSDIYSPTDKEIVYYVNLYPSVLIIIDYPGIIYSADQTLNLTYQFIDPRNLEPIMGILVKLYYIDLATSTKVFLNLESITDLDGKVNFLVNLPDSYSNTSIFLIAEAEQTASNQGASNSVELFITESPTFINLNTLTDSFQYYIDDTLNITFELFDYFEDIISFEILYIEIETPTTFLNLVISCGETITLNFTELGLYRVNVTYKGSSNYLPTYTQIFYGIKPYPTSLEFTEEIPEVSYLDQFLFLRAKLKNNISNIPLEGELVKFYATDDTSTILIFDGFTDSEGLISYKWDIDEALINKDINIYAVYEFALPYYYENCSSAHFSTYVSKYSVDLILIEFPDFLSPLIEEHFIIKAYKAPTMTDVAKNCHIQLLLLLPNGTYITIKQGLTNNSGELEFDWLPNSNIFSFNQVMFEIYIVEDNLYNGGFILSKEVPVDKLLSYLSIIPEKSQVLPGEEISIYFDLVNIYGDQLHGQIINVEITNPLYTVYFTIEIGVNNTYYFVIPNYGAFEISGYYEGNDRNYPSSATTSIFSDKFELDIELSILEAFTQNLTCSFKGKQWNYSILDYHQNFTLVANVSIKDYNLPMEGIEVYFYFIQEAGDFILIGSNFTNDKGIAIFCWDTSNFSLPKWWHSSALIAKIPETVYNHPSESDPIYFNLRKIKTLIVLDTFTSKFQINIEYKINITLYDEFLINLKGFNITVKIYFKGKVVNSYKILTNGSSYFKFTPSKLGNYIIKASFTGSEEYKACCETEPHKCVKKEPTNLKIILPDYIRPDQPYSVKIILFNSTGGLLTGELVEVTIMYHDESGNTQYYYMSVIIGENNTFDWIFPEYDEYVIKALYHGSEDYLGCKVVAQSRPIVILSFSFWEIFFFIIVPGLMICPSLERKGKKKSKGERRKKMLSTILLIFVILFSNYVGITFICSQIETTGLIKDLQGISNYNPEDPVIKQSQDIMKDLVDSSDLGLGDINPEWIPNLENDTAVYDLVVEDSTVIPTEYDENPPEVSFIGIPDGANLMGDTQIKVMAFDKESGIQKVSFKLLYQSMTLEEEGFFTYNLASDLYTYNLSTSDHNDGEYEIYAIAVDNNNNSFTSSIEIQISNYPVYDVSETKFEQVTVELTDYINVSFISSVNGSFTLEVLNQELKSVTTLSGLVTAEELNILEISIEPLKFKVGNYKIVLTVFMINSIGILNKETQELKLMVLKESVKLELEVVEGEDIYSEHYITFKARLIENDGYLSDSGEMIENEPKLPISGQVLTFKIGDSDYQKKLGTRVTNSNGYATFTFNVSLSKGQHIFNVSFQGNNIYKSLEGMKLFENKGSFTDIKISHVSTPIPYNEIATIKARLYADENIIPHQTLYFNISNTLYNYYIGMAMTDINGEATITFPCDYSPGTYNVIVSYDGKSIYANNVSTFENRLEIIRQNVDLTIETREGSVINCPYYYNTTLVAKLLVENTDRAIEGIILNFELILFPAGPSYPIGTSTTDLNGLASIDLNPSIFNNLDPDAYTLNVFCSSNDFYNGNFYRSDVYISQDVPIISIQGTESSFFTEFQIYAALLDSQLNPINGENLNFLVLDSSTGETLYEDIAMTDFSGGASIIVEPEDFPYVGDFDIFVFYGGNNIYLSTQSIVMHGLQVNYHSTQLLIQGPEKGNVIDPYEFELFLRDSQGTPITDQKIFIECYKKDGKTNLLKPNTFVTTDNIYGNATYSLNLIIPGTFIIKVYYLPLSDDDSDNDGFLQSQNELKFIIERAPADISIIRLNLPRIMRGDRFVFTVEAGLEEAKREVIPINVFVDIDLNGDGIAFDDIFSGRYSFLKNRSAVISYTIPLDDTFQAGQYTFTVVIDEEWSSFTGNTSFLIDFVERTTMKIKYHILNDRASGQHYLWEEEEIEFILADEDGDPLPDSCIIKDGSIIGINRFIQYQIVNGENIYDTREVNLIDGNYIREHIPSSYGFEICTVMYEGDRFFAPSKSMNVARILRRPLILEFIDYKHNNPERLDDLHSGNRGENITIVARVQDYLDEIYLENQIVQFGHSGTYFDVSNKSVDGGWVYLNVKLDESNSLIQAGDYILGLIIRKSEYYQSTTALHSDPIHIFEIGSISFSIGDISMEDMNYVIKPTITYYDEDGCVVRGVEFFVQLIEKKSGEAVYTKTMTSGPVEIAIFDPGAYMLVVTLSDNVESTSTNIHEIATTFYQLFYLFLLTESGDTTVVDNYIVPFIIPLVSDALIHALELSANWDAEMVTFVILLVLNVVSGVLGNIIKFTWTTLLKVVLLSIFCGLISKMKYFYFGMISQPGIQKGLIMVVGELTGPDWLISGLGFILGGIGLLAALIGNRPEAAAKRARKTGNEMQKSLDVNIILLELGILCLAGIIEYIFSSAQGKGVWGLLGSFVGAIPFNMWIGYHNYYSLVKCMSFASLLLLIITNALISLVIDLIWQMIPKVGGFWGFIVDLARNLLKLTLTIIVFTAVSVFFGFAVETVGVFIKALLTSILVNFVFGAILNIFFESYQFTSVFSHTSLSAYGIKGHTK